MSIEYIPPGTVLTCSACNGTGVQRWFWPWTCAYCDGSGRVVHMPNSTTTTYTAATQEAPEDTCEDLGCVDGRTMQGRKYDYDGIAEEQWAPCGRRASTCPQEAPEDGEGE